MITAALVVFAFALGAAVQAVITRGIIRHKAERSTAVNELRRT